MTKRPQPNRHVMLNVFQHLVYFFVPSADAPFIRVPAYRGRHRTGFSGTISMKMIATQRGSCQDRSKTTGRRRRVSQLKKDSCYDNFSFGKKSYGKLNKAAVLEVFGSVPPEIHLGGEWLNLFRPVSR
jgi:hypothetical protein